MKIAFFDTHPFEKKYFETANSTQHFEITYFETTLNLKTAALAKGCDIVCSFINDDLNAKTLAELQKLGIKLIALRSAGYNHVDLNAAKQLSLPVVRVPEYSPHAVAEYAVALLLTLNRKIHRAYHRVRDLNFSLDGLVGKDLFGKTVGVIGTGKIGSLFCRIMHGFGCKVLAVDIEKNLELSQKYDVHYVELKELYAKADMISLHTPLTKQTQHLVNAQAFREMKQGTLLINTGRGALIETAALIQSLKSGHLGGAALDVYEEEEKVFFHDLSTTGLEDDQLARLLTFPNVLITSHQAFLTEEALHNIAQTTLSNIREFSENKTLTHEICI